MEIRINGENSLSSSIPDQGESYRVFINGIEHSVWRMWDLIQQRTSSRSWMPETVTG